MKKVYQCQQCGHKHSQWQGQCPACLKWNTLIEAMINKPNANQQRNIGYAGETSKIVTLEQIPLSQVARTPTGSKELDRVLGGGLVPGSVVLIGGDPGIGKSTLLLQALCYLSEQKSALYISGEESLQQVALRAKRLNLNARKLKLYAETNLLNILKTTEVEKPSFLVIDSIQTCFTDNLSAAPGSVSQLRECTALLVRLAKARDICIFVIGHVTKEGALAGPRVLEHMVDTVLYFEGQKDARFRVIRAFKNRYGAANEIGVFAMMTEGLKGVANPSALFLQREEKILPGSIILATLEGSRPLLIEVQALVDTNHSGQGKRVSIGFDNQRLVLLLAVLNRHGSLSTFSQDIFINIVGGVKITETGIDLPVLIAIISSLKNQSIDKTLVAFGEIGLSGEIRPIQSGLERLQEAYKHGFKKAIIPKANQAKQTIDGMKLYPVSHIQEVIDLLREEELLI